MRSTALIEDESYDSATTTSYSYRVVGTIANAELYRREAMVVPIPVVIRPPLFDKLTKFAKTDLHQSKSFMNIG